MRLAYSVLNDLPDDSTGKFFAFDYRVGWFPNRFEMVEYLESDCLNELIKRLIASEHDAVFINSGFYCPFNIEKIDSVLRKLFSEKDFILAGTLLNSSSEPPTIHPKAVFLNLNKIRQVGAPKFIKASIDSLILYHEENILELIQPLPDYIEQNHFYVKPSEADLFLKTLKQKRTSIKLSQTANKYLDFQLNKNQETKLYIFNNEPFNAQELPKLSSIIGPCSGLKKNLWLHQSGFDSNTKVIHFDISPIALNWAKNLIDSPSQKVIEYFRSIDTNLFQKILDFFDGQFTDHWELYQNCEHTFLYLDVVKNFDQLSDYFMKDSLFWFSNCFYYKDTFLDYGGSEKVTDQLIKMLDYLNTFAPDVWLDGIISPGSNLPNCNILGKVSAVYPEIISHNRKKKWRLY